MTAEAVAGRWLTISDIMRTGKIPGCRNTIKKLIRSGELTGSQLTENGWYRVHELDFDSYLNKLRGTDGALHRASDAASTDINDFAVRGSVWQRPAVQAAFEGGPVQDHLTRRDDITPVPVVPAAPVRPGASETRPAGQGEIPSFTVV